MYALNENYIDNASFSTEQVNANTEAFAQTYVEKSKPQQEEYVQNEQNYQIASEQPMY